MPNIRAIRKITEQIYPPHITTLKEGTPYLNRKAFAVLVQETMPTFKLYKNNINRLFQIPMIHLPENIKAMLNPSLKKWFIEIHSKGGLHGRRPIVPLVFLRPFPQQLAKNLNLVSTYKQPNVIKAQLLIKKLSSHLKEVPPELKEIILDRAGNKKPEDLLRNWTRHSISTNTH